MKTYLLSIPNNLRMKSEKLDAEAILCGKTWQVFNDDGIKQVFIFQKGGNLIVSTNGSVSTSFWKYIPENGSIMISANKDLSTGSMYQPTLLDNVLFVLSLDGAGAECMLCMIDESNQYHFKPKSLSEIQDYILGKVTPPKPTLPERYEPISESHHEVPSCVRFMNNTCRRVSDNGKTFYVYHDDTYAFDEVIGQYPGAILVYSAKQQRYELNYDDTKKCVFSTEPYTRYFKNGLVVEGILIGTPGNHCFYYHKTGWDECLIRSKTGEEYELCDIRKENAYICNDYGVTKIAYEEGKDIEQGQIIIFLLLVIVVVTLVWSFISALG